MNTSHMQRVVAAAACALALAGVASALRAQASGGTFEPGWTLMENVQGSSDSAGFITRSSTTLGYDINRHLSVDAGIPFYFIHASSSASGLTSANGIGNVFVDLRLTAAGEEVTFISNLRGTAPTGDKSEGLSTGHATFDWSNYVGRSFGRILPYAELGVANTVSDTPYYVRPFSSFGLVGHFEGGLGLQLVKIVRVSAAAYAIAASGEQTLYSRFMRQGGASGMGMPVGASPSTQAAGSGPGSGAGGGPQRVYETAAVITGSSSLGNDHGFFAGVNVSPNRWFDVSAGYSRSVPYQEDSFYFGFGVNIAALWKSAGQP